MKTICIAGKNNIAVDVMNYCKKIYPQYRLVLVTNRNEKGLNSWQKSAKWFAEKCGIEIVDLNDVYEIEDLLFLSCEFDRIVRPDKFKSTELYNIHFSLLPKYKGCFPSVLPILFGDVETGVTLHRMRFGIDTGEIIDQQKISIEKKDSSLDLYNKLMKIGTDVVVRNIDSILTGRVSSKQQSKEGSTYYSINYIDYSNLSLDINNTAYQIQNQIRAFAFRPYQLISWNGEKYIDSEITNNVSEKSAGTILMDNDVLTRVSTIDYDIIMYKDTFGKAIELIKAGRDASILCESSKIIESKNEYGWSLLTVAVYNNNIDMVKWLIKKGADINVLNNNGTTLLMYAKDCFINTGDPSMFEYLIDLKLDVNLIDYYGKSLQDYCEEEGISKIGKIIFK